MLKKLVSNSAFGYIFIQYATYITQFIGALWVASTLGAYYLGIWGAFNLVIQYIEQINFGIPTAVQVEGTVEKYKEGYVSKLLGNGILIMVALSLLVGLVFGLNEFLDWQIGAKYKLIQYLPYIWLIGCSKYFCTVYMGIYRIYGQLKEINFYKSIWPAAILVTVIFSSSSELIDNLVKVYTVVTLLSLLVFIWRCPVKIDFEFNFKLWKLIHRRGWHLFLYSAAFYLILLSLRSLVSEYYSVKEFGYFTFAFSLASSLFLLLKAVAFLLNPKIIHSFNKQNKQQNKNLLNRLRTVYITGSYGIVYFGIFIFPYFLNFFPEYHNSFEVFVVLALTIALQSNVFGYSGLVIAKNGERKLGLLSFAGLILNIVLCFILIKVFDVQFALVALGTMFAYLIYIYFVGQIGRKTIKEPTGFRKVLLDIFPLRLLFPYSLTLALLFLNVPNFYYGAPLIVFTVINYKSICRIFATAIQMFKNPNFINF